MYCRWQVPLGVVYSKDIKRHIDEDHAMGLYERSRLAGRNQDAAKQPTMTWRSLYFVTSAFIVVRFVHIYTTVCKRIKGWRHLMLLSAHALEYPVGLSHKEYIFMESFLTADKEFQELYGGKDTLHSSAQAQKSTLELRVSVTAFDKARRLSKVERSPKEWYLSQQMMKNTRRRFYKNWASRATEGRKPRDATSSIITKPTPYVFPL